MARNYDFRLLTTRPASTGWTSASINEAQAAKAAALAEGAVAGTNSALAKAPITAEALRTTPSTLSDATLGSRRFVNPNTGVRDVAATGSVYAMSDVPAYLSQAVAGLNAEQALRRSVQAEWNDRLLRNAEDSSNPYVWMEAIRAASVNPGSSVAFGQAIQDPNRGLADMRRAQGESVLNNQRASILHQASGNLYRVNKYTDLANTQPKGSPWAEDARNRARDEMFNFQFAQPLAAAAAGGSGWTSRPRTNSWSNWI
jgi:hypothetical protein